MQRSDWLEKYFEKVALSSDEGRNAVEYVRVNNIRVGIRHARKSIGAFWTLNRKFFLNSVHFTRETVLENPRAWTIFVHEVRHLQQGALTALSVYGELEAWRVEFNLYKKITNQPLRPHLEDLLSLPLNMDRNNLHRARELMMAHAGRGYGARWLPLYPMQKEIKYWVTRKQS